MGRGERRVARPVRVAVPDGSGAVPDAVVAATVEERWRQFLRWGPYALLAVAAAMAAASAELLSTGTERTVAVWLVGAALLLQLAWHARRTGRTPSRPGEARGPRDAPGGDAAEAVLVPGAPGPASVAYFTLRAALALALTWCNPFFAVFACIGYFDAVHLLPPRPLCVRAGLTVVALTLAGSQSGGIPPASALQWAAFGGLFLLNAGLAVGLSHLGAKEAEKAAERAATIAELARANTRLEQALAENATLQAQLVLQAREAGVADERRRLAAEIHDTLAQGLTGIIAQLQAAEAADPRQARVHHRRAAALARHSLGEARRSVQNLGPAALEHDTLPDALEKTVGAWAERTGIRARFTPTGTAHPLHDEVAATLLRIAQEALANAERHSGATRAGVTLSYMGDEVVLDVRDDGRGFDPAAPPVPGAHGGFGLAGMRARAERLAGALAVESAPGEGTAISVRVPLAPHA
ncbi:histidine kinase [Streptomyces omiyaensis]|uniref:sensor histidine kinase n=1 Tax=Streptomyces omiyaensis TaxID=68247 RepID=UPI00167B7D2E|nr:histidine kinase [Streptomyces omiyaensis]